MLFSRNVERLNDFLHLFNHVCLQEPKKNSGEAGQGRFTCCNILDHAVATGQTDALGSHTRMTVALPHHCRPLPISVQTHMTSGCSGSIQPTYLNIQLLYCANFNFWLILYSICIAWSLYFTDLNENASRFEYVQKNQFIQLCTFFSCFHISFSSCLRNQALSRWLLFKVNSLENIIQNTELQFKYSGDVTA